MHGNAVKLILHPLRHVPALQPPKHERQRDGHHHQHADLAQQDARHLTPREAQHAQTGQLARAFGQRDAHRVVHHPEIHHAAQQHPQQRHRTGHPLHHLEHRPDRIQPIVRSHHLRPLIQRPHHRRRRAGPDLQQRPGQHIPIPQQPVQCLTVHVHPRAQVLVDQTCHRHLKDPAAALQLPHRQQIPFLQAQPFGQIGIHHQPIRRQRNPLQAVIHRLLQQAIGRQAPDGRANAMAAERQLHRYRTRRLGVLHTTDGTQLMHRLRRTLLDERHRHVVQLGQPVLAVHQIRERPLLHARQDDQTARHGQPQHAQQRPPRAALQLTQHHPHRL